MYDMFMTYAALIRDAPHEKLLNEKWLASLICIAGLEDEKIGEYPPSMWPYCGNGLRLWQQPEQLAAFLAHFAKLGVSSYVEIGCRRGGTFLFCTEFMRKFGTLKHSVAVDIASNPALEAYARSDTRIEYHNMSSHSPEFAALVGRINPDIIFVDGDHSKKGCEADMQLALASTARYIVMHDIASEVCPGVVSLWDGYSKKYGAHAFTQQFADSHKSLFGIGILDKEKPVSASN